jgi:hypothetical protein
MVDTNHTHCISISKHVEEGCIGYVFWSKKKYDIFTFLEEKKQVQGKERKRSYNGWLRKNVLQKGQSIEHVATKKHTMKTFLKAEWQINQSFPVAFF